MYCKGRSKDGNQCQRSCSNNYCYQHAKRTGKQTNEQTKIPSRKRFAEKLLATKRWGDHQDNIQSTFMYLKFIQPLTDKVKKHIGLSIEHNKPLKPKQIIATVVKTLGIKHKFNDLNALISYAYEHTDHSIFSMIEIVAKTAFPGLKITLSDYTIPTRIYWNYPQPDEYFITEPLNENGVMCWLLYHHKLVNEQTFPDYLY